MYIVYGPGVHLVSENQNIELLSTKSSKKSFVLNTKHSFKDSSVIDDVQLIIDITYHPNIENIVSLWQKFGTDYDDKILPVIVDYKTQDVMLSSKENPLDKASLVDMLKTEIAKEIDQYYITVDQIQIEIK
eukprot:TRINITY_DN6761_c0_g1_i2.p1 TRINITY_DN6761_c0_g1~~TRINITY_DN6761_c0_g1_i2.p1  ORF type:complete len:131 (+),score=16.18 TRINITY_DN6761_c0_g1_i2:63-455(+)